MILQRVAGLAAAALISAAAVAGPEPNQPAPVFQGQTVDGQTVSLDDFKGSPVILEWTNHDCPYVQKHYETTNMQSLQKRLTDQGAVWLTVISSAPGKQGHVAAAEAKQLTQSRQAAPSHVILDPDGQIGRLYEARTTPHMFVIDRAGVLRYMGAIDDKPSTRPATVNGARNYVLAAFEAVQAGRAPDAQATQPYGCSVKY
ncbi:MAG: redoxin domain-containing protein [Rhodothalassiaceae bacterium]